MRITLKSLLRLINREVPVIVGSSIETTVQNYLIENPPTGYEHPLTHPATMITEDSGHRFVTDTNKSTWNGKQDALGFTPVSDNDVRLSDARTPTTHSHDYEPANVNIQAHVISAHAPANAQKNSDITKGEIETKLTGEIISHTHPVSGGLDPWTVIKLAEDFTTSLVANTNVTNFLFTPAQNKTYLIFGYFLLRTATATVGARPGISFPSNLTDATLRMEAANSLTASAIQLFGARTTKNAASTGLATTADSHWGSLDGIMITGANTSGNLQVTLASETAGTNVTIKGGSILMYREL